MTTELKQTPKPNTEQQKAIDTYKRDGIFLVLAGPGTGKTFTISQRIKTIIEAGTPQERILCLTFSDTAAKEMKKGVEKALDVTSSNVNIYTYHSFCLEIIKNHPDIFGIGENIKIITDSVKKAFMKECIDENLEKRNEPTTFQTDKNGPYFFIDKILERIEEIKKYRLDKKKYFDNLNNNPDWIPLVNEKYENWQKTLLKNPDKPKTKVLIDAEKKIAKAQELWELYSLYKLKMQRKNFLDFGDMITMLLDEFEKNESFAAEIASNYDYIIADEYQDTNLSQNEVLFNLAENMPKKNVFVVGDDDQIIYTFQGARLDSIKNFITRLNVKDEDVICFKENRRSTEKILELVRQIVLQDDISLEKDSYFKRFNISKELSSANMELIPRNTDVKCTIYRDSLEEKIDIVDKIKELINSTDCPIDKNTKEKKLSEIAILANKHDELEEYAKLLQAENIPYETANGKNIFEIQSFVVMFLYMQFLCNSTQYSDSFFKMMLSKPFDINEKDYEVLYRTRNTVSSFIDNMRKFKDKGYTYKLTKKNGEEINLSFAEPDKIDRFLKIYDELKDIKQCANLKDAVLMIGNKTGIFEYYFNNPVNRSENIAGLKKLVDEAESYLELEKPATFEFFVSYLEKAMFEGIKIFADKPPVKQNSVKLVTYHGSKGMEFEYVFMPYLIKKQNKFENPNIPLSVTDDISKDNRTGKTISDEEKKRITKSNLIKLIYVAMTRAKHSLNLSYTKIRNDGKDAEPLELLTLQTVKELLSIEEFEKDKDKQSSFESEVIKSLTICDRDYNKEFKDYLNSIISGKMFSASSVNCYLSCHREYLYTHLLGLSSKTENADKAHFGTAVHAAYEFAVNYALENKVFPPKAEFIHKFENTLKELPVSSKVELKRMLNDGANVLIKEKDGECAYDRLKITPIEQLYKAEYEFTFDINGAKFTGKIDRIDKLPDGTYIIYDYKTGDKKDEKDICEGGTHEDYYNQMALYKHYLRKELACGYEDITTIFLFPRDFKNLFELKLSQENCERVVDKFKNAIADIKANKFEPMLNKNECSTFCPYKNSFCGLNII